jgi:O-antigen ligase
LTHGHNSVIDLLAEVGIIGVALCALVFVVAWASASARLTAPGPTDEDRIAGRAAILGLVALLVLGVTEPLVTIPVGWFVLVISTALHSPLVGDTGQWPRMLRWLRTSW